MLLSTSFLYVILLIIVINNKISYNMHTDTGGDIRMDLGDYVNVHEAAQLINRKESLIRTLCQQGRFKGVTKVGKSWLIPRQEILKYQPAKRGIKPKGDNDRVVFANALQEANRWKEGNNNDQ